MAHSPRQDAACRIALAAYLHDLGKFAERARITEALDIQDAHGNTRVDLEKMNYCPAFNGRYTHVHAAYTAIAFDLLEPHLPQLKGTDMTPFAAWNQRDADDSLINAAARHHKPDTFLQWIIATADRLASGFEREEFAAYNQAEDETQNRPLNHYTTRQWTLLERIRLNQASHKKPGYRYPLAALAPATLFPVTAEEGEQDSTHDAQQRYRQLWQAFTEGLREIPERHRESLPLWLDHFDSLWQAYTHAIPSATAGLNSSLCPDVALYDHSKTTAALAVALWRYHADHNHTPEDIREQLRAQWDKERRQDERSRRAWTEEKFLLIQGDLFGIQDFIFASGGATQKRAAKLLRGRSFYVSLLTELAALKLLDALHLPSTSQVINAAGKFLIVAPNTQETQDTLAAVSAECNQWFLQQTYGQAGIGIAALPACCEDFLSGSNPDTSPFRELMRRLFERLEIAKLRRFDLCGTHAAPAIFSDFLEQFTQGACEIDGRSPAVEQINDVWMSRLAADQIRAGGWLANRQRVLITRQNLNHNGSLGLPIFGYHVAFTADEETTGKFGPEARSGNLRRAFDFSLPESSEAVLWNGYARRHINAYVPRFGDCNAYDQARYQGLDLPQTADEFKSFNHLAKDALSLDAENRWQGSEALMTLKGDVDNLGQIFQKGLERPTFAKMAALSRQMNAFFAIHLPWLCAQGEENGVKCYQSTYTVFAGGDDFFLIGPWHTTLRLASRMKTDFARYVANNPDIHFSAGLSMTKPGLPIRQLADLAEEALEQAKAHNPDHINPAPKNAVTAFGQSVTWPQFDELMLRVSGLGRLDQEHSLSTGYLYALLSYIDQAEKMAERPENALWYSRFAYRTRRLVETLFRKIEDPALRESRRRALQTELAQEIAKQGIEKHGAAYRIALFTYLYQQRD